MKEKKKELRIKNDEEEIKKISLSLFFSRIFILLLSMDAER